MGVEGGKGLCALQVGLLYGRVHTYMDVGLIRRFAFIDRQG